MKYTNAFDIACLVRRSQRGRREYRDGVEHAAALAAAQTVNDYAAADAIDAEFQRYLLWPHAWADPVV